MGRSIVELDRDYRRVVKESCDSTEDFDVFFSAYLREHWTLEEIEDYATICGATPRYPSEAFNKWLRSYWENWLQLVADAKSRARFSGFDVKQLLSMTPKAASVFLPLKAEELATFKEAEKRKSGADRAANRKGNARFDRKGRKASAK